MTNMDLLLLRIRICAEKGGGGCGKQCPLYSLSVPSEGCRREVLKRRAQAESIITAYCKTTRIPTWEGGNRYG